jgi:hypothetical protein
LYDEEDYVLDTYNWDEGKKPILVAFETSIQHPKEHVVWYFGGTPVSVIEQGSPRRSPRENQQKPMMKKKKYFQVLDLLDTLIQLLRVRHLWSQKI